MMTTGIDKSWSGLYRAGGVSAIVYIVLVLVPVVLVFTAPLPPATGGAAILNYIAANKLVYLTELVCFVGLSVPALVVFGGLGVALKEVNKSAAAVGGLVGIVSEIVALAPGSSPQSLHGGLVLLSDQYMAATAEVQRASLAAAAEGLMAATNAVSSSGILTSAAILILSLVMRRSAFSKVTAYVGIATGVVGIVSEALRPMIGAVYSVFGLLLVAWFILAAIVLLRLGAQRVTASR